jgi:Putative auto-transporter adhesin, head GIN domain
MKKILFVMLAFISVNCFAQPWKTIKGNGQPKKETRTVSAFTSLSSGGPMEVRITYGNSNTVVVDAEENLLPYIETTVKNGKLSIGAQKNYNLQSNSKIVVVVTMTTIQSLELAGSGSITGDGKFSNNDKTVINVSGSGGLRLAFDHFADLDVAVSGSGDIKLTGSTNSISAKVSGSGNIDCSAVRSKDVGAKISGSGNLTVDASNSVDAKISGSGNVMYKGDAANIKSKTSGSGKVIKI